MPFAVIALFGVYMNRLFFEKENHIIYYRKMRNLFLIYCKIYREHFLKLTKYAYKTHFLIATQHLVLWVCNVLING